MKKDISMIWVSFEKEGTHCYPEALKNPALEDVKFLGYPHRHLFKFRVWIEVFADDREIEFIQFKRWLSGLFDSTLDLNDQSCEMIARDLHKEVSTRYPNRETWVEVSEDGENGAFIKFDRRSPAKLSTN